VLRSSIPKPLLGFGPVGWVAASIVSALFVVALSGFDFQAAYLDAIARLFGAQGLYWYFLQIHYGHSLALHAPVFSLIGLLYTLPALFIFPVPVARWKYLLVIFWALLHPLIFSYYILVEPLARLFANTPFDPRAWCLASGLVELSTCVILFVVTRSWRVFSACLIATVVV